MFSRYDKIVLCHPETFSWVPVGIITTYIIVHGALSDTYCHMFQMSKCQCGFVWSFICWGLMLCHIETLNKDGMWMESLDSQQFWLPGMPVTKENKWVEFSKKNKCFNSTFMVSVYRFTDNKSTAWGMTRAAAESKYWPFIETLGVLGDLMRGKLRFRFQYNKP